MPSVKSSSISTSPMLPVASSSSSSHESRETTSFAQQTEQPLDKSYWVLDDYRPKCVGCSTEFGVFTRRHHCRGWGEIFCARCLVKANFAGTSGLICQSCGTFNSEGTLRWFLIGTSQWKSNHTAQALESFVKAAKGGIPMAQLFIGYCKLKGIGGTVNPTDAFQCFSLASQHAARFSDYFLGKCHSYGIGTAVNPSEAY